MPKSQTDRRQFSRIRFDAVTTLRSDGLSQPTQLLDISLRGALIVEPEDWPGASTRIVELELVLDDPANPLRLPGTIVHSDGTRLGMAFRDVALDDITQLRRLVELNLGSPDQLDRELEALWRTK